METGEFTRRECLHRLSRVARAGVVPVERAAEAWGAPTREAALRLARLRRGGWVRHVRRGVYYLPSLDVGGAEVVAEDSWVLADELFAPCYIGGWTAAGHWGLTEQLFRTTFVVTAATVRSSEMEALGTPFRLAIVPADRLSGCVEAWRGSTRVNVSSPERTLVDAFRHPDWVGGVRHLAEILLTYSGLGADAEDRLVGELERYGNGAAHKRAGYIAEMVWPEAVGLIEAARGGVTTGVIKLDPAIARRGRMVKRWGLWINATIGGDRT